MNNLEKGILTKEEIVKDNDQEKKASSLQTILATTNCLIGSASLVLPINFKQSGIFTSIAFISIIGSISYRTCLILLENKNNSEEFLTSLVNRKLSSKYTHLCSFISGMALISVSLIYYLFLTNIFYEFITYFLKNHQTFYYDKNVFSFRKFSFQYSSIIILLYLFFIIKYKNFLLIIKFQQLGFITILIYLIFILFIGISQILSQDFLENLKNANFFSFDILNLAGTFAISFMAHNITFPIFSKNKNQQNNSRDLSIAYILAGSLYFLMGFFGYLGILTEKNYTGSENTVMDFISPKSFFAFLIKLLYFIHLSTSLPVSFYVGKGVLFENLSNNLIKSYFNHCFLGLSMFLGIFNFSPIIILGISGAICGFFVIYLIPIKIYFKNLDYHKNRKEFYLFNSILFFGFLMALLQIIRIFI